VPRDWALPLCVEQHGVRFRISGLDGCAVEELASLFLPFLKEGGAGFQGTPEINFRPIEKPTDILAVLAPLYVKHGLFPIHAAGIGIGDGAILCPGASGTGKSTLIRAARAAGYRIVGDDVVLLRRTARGTEVVPWACAIQDETKAKRPLPLAPEALVSGLLRGVFFLSIGTLPCSSLAPAAAGSALLRLSAQLLWSSDAEKLLAQRDLIRELIAVPCHDLRLGRDVIDDPADFVARVFSRG
jgi:hypothetical protein